METIISWAIAIPVLAVGSVLWAAMIKYIAKEVKK